MAIFSIKDLSFYYPEEEQAVLRQISLTIDQGQFVVLCGPSGSGKTTLLRQLKKAIRPSGRQLGSIQFQRQPFETYPLEQEAFDIGYVFQDPDNQIVTHTVWHEMAFGLENMGFEPKDIRKRVAEIANVFGIERWFRQSVHELSGGQKQLLNLAAVLAMKPKVLLLDEPTSQLDPIAAREFIQMLSLINQELSITIILSEHRLDGLLELADQLVVMKQGTIKYQGDPRTVLLDMSQAKDSPFTAYLPNIPELYMRMEQGKAQGNKLPLTIKEGKAWLDPIMNISAVVEKEYPALDVDRRRESRVLMECKGISYSYEQTMPPVIDKCTFTVYEGEWLMVLGGNGTGKSTFLQLLAGILVPQRGTVLYNGLNLHKRRGKDRFKNIAYLAQNPMANFLHDTVSSELEAASTAISNESKLQTYIDQFDIHALLHKHPYDLSGGEKQVVALIAALLSEPEILFLDEPTKGMDPDFKHHLATILQELNDQGLTIVMVTHDIEFAAKYASRCALLFDGDMTYEGSPRAFFSENYVYTTSINRMVREYLPLALTPEDVLKQWT